MLATLEEQPPDYDLDEEDAAWLEAFNKTATLACHELQNCHGMPAFQMYDSTAPDERLCVRVRVCVVWCGVV